MNDNAYTGRRTDYNFVALPVGNSTYIIINNKTKKIVRSANCCGAIIARERLQPKRGETLYIRVGNG